MKVRELLVGLAHVDPDLDILVSSRWGQHLGRVELRRRRSPLEMAFWVERHGPDVLYPCLWLQGERRWFGPPPPWELCGRFRDRAGLDRQLAALDREPT